MLYLSLVGFACRNDSQSFMTRCIDQNKQTPSNAASQLVTLLAVAASRVQCDPSIRISKSKRCILKIKTTGFETSITFAFIPFELHSTSVVQWTTLIKYRTLKNPVTWVEDQYLKSRTECRASPAMAKQSGSDPNLQLLGLATNSADWTPIT